ncbi:unnamed protein product [Caenorhabditis angaria]|uniref:Uncharacterized protein n=1 Tax=Caenorhabditis angaria TaxID=860376 RepID=A0A9P1IEB2_9PELO|nr:unnamed protein product [Caenorhabditis angaria]
MDSTKKMDVIAINDTLEDEPSSCGCRFRCCAEIPYYADNIETFSPRIAALILMVTQKTEMFDESHVQLWAQRTKLEPGTAQKIEAIHAFSKCPKILEHVGKFERWKEAVAKIDEELGKIEEDQEVIEIHVTYASTSRFQFYDRWYVGYDKKEVRIENVRIGFEDKEFEEDKTFGYYGMENKSKVQMFDKTLHVHFVNWDWARIPPLENA